MCWKDASVVRAQWLYPGDQGSISTTGITSDSGDLTPSLGLLVCAYGAHAYNWAKHPCISDSLAPLTGEEINSTYIY